MDTDNRETPRGKDAKTGLEIKMTPMLVVFNNVERKAIPGGGLVEVVTFKVWQPDDLSDPGSWSDLDNGTHMVGTNYLGEQAPVLLTSLPIMVRPPAGLITSRELPRA